MSSMLWAAAAVASAGPPAVTAEQAIETARAFFAIERRARETCPETEGEEIVVCHEPDDPERYRVPGDPGRGRLSDEAPRAPDLEPKYPGVVAARGCFIPPCPRPMPVMIDLKAIPEAPPGSNADRIAKGELAGP